MTCTSTGAGFGSPGVEGYSRTNSSTQNNTKSISPTRARSRPSASCESLACWGDERGGRQVRVRESETYQCVFLFLSVSHFKVGSVGQQRRTECTVGWSRGLAFRRICFPLACQACLAEVTWTKVETQFSGGSSPIGASETQFVAPREWLAWRFVWSRFREREKGYSRYQSLCSFPVRTATASE